MIHIRIDTDIENGNLKLACGLGPEMPLGDKYFFEGEIGSHFHVDCPGCAPYKVQLGTPISQISGRPGHSGFDEFVRIANSWGYE